MSISTLDTQGSPGILGRFAWLLSAFWFREVLQAGFSVWLARVDPARFGEYFLALSLGQVVLFISELGLNQHLAVLLTRDPQGARRLLGQVAALKGGLLALAWLGLAGVVRWQGYEPGLALAVLVMAGGMGLEALASSFCVRLQVQSRQAAEGRLRALAALLGFALGYLGLIFRAAAWVLALHRLAESLAALAGAVRAAWPTGPAPARTGTDGGQWRPWAGGLVFVGMAAASMLYNRTNLLFLQNAGGPLAVAQYGVTWQLIDGPAGIIADLLLRGVLFPLLLAAWPGQRERHAALVHHWALRLGLVSLALSFLLAVEADRIIGLIYGPQYEAAAAMQPWLSLCLPLACLHNLAAYAMISRGEQNRLLIYYLAVLAANLALCAVLVPAWGMEGAVGAMVLTKALLAALTVGRVQLGPGLFARRDLVRLASGAALGAALYWLGGRLLPREAAEALALMPLAWLAWRQGTMPAGRPPEEAPPVPGERRGHA